MIENTIALIAIMAGVGAGALALQNDFVEDQIYEHGVIGYILVVFIGGSVAGIVYYLLMYLLGCL